MTIGAFNADSYRGSFGDQLSALAGASNVASQDALSDPNQPAFDPDSEANVQRQNVSNQNVAQLPSPLQTSRALGRLRPPQGAKVGGDTSLAPQSSSPFFDADQHKSAAAYDYADNASDSELKAHINQFDEHIGAGTKDHGITDMNHLWQETYQSQLQQRAKQSMMDGEQASQYMKPSWRDKAAMMLDATNRASIIQAQNPTMSQGAVWAAATRGALDGWEAHVQGAHDAYLKNQQAMRDQAGKDADAAVKRYGDTFGFWQKGEQLRMQQQQRDETERHNRAMEEIDRTKASATEKKDEREGVDKGTPLTLEDDFTDKNGNTWPKGTVGVMKSDGTFVSGGMKGRKAGTQAADKPEVSPKDAESAQKDSDAEWEKSQGSVAKAVGYKNADGSKMTPDQVADAKKAYFRQHNPKAYKAIYGEDVDLSAPPPKPGMTPTKGTPSWAQ